MITPHSQAGIPPIDETGCGPSRWISEARHWKARAELAEADLRVNMDLVAEYRLAHIKASPLTRWAPISTHPKDGEPMLATDKRGKWHILWANPELDHSLYTHWMRPTPPTQPRDSDGSAERRDNADWLDPKDDSVGRRHRPGEVS